MATLAIEIPDDLLPALGENAELQARYVLEAVACECYRTESLTQAQCSKLAKLPRAQFVDLLMQRQIPDPASGEEMVEGYQAIKRLFPK